MKRIYFELENPTLITWLKSQPTGKWEVLLGSDTPEHAVEMLLAKITKEGVEFAQWVVRKIQAGELDIRAHTKVDLPQGVLRG